MTQNKKMLSDRLKTLLHEKGISLQQFAEMCDLPLETVRNVYYGKTNDPKLSTAIKMAGALEMSVNCLLGKCPHTPEERAVLQNYRKCGKHGQAMIQMIARYEAGAIKGERESIEKHKITCFLPRGEARKGIVLDICEREEIETSIKEAFVAIQMQDNDFAPIFCKGDILVFEDRFPEHGERAAFFCGNRMYIRKFLEEEGQYRLKCLHPYGEDLVLKRLDEFDYIGTCIDVLRS